MCVRDALPVHMSVYFVCVDANGCQKRCLIPFGMELQTVVTHCVGARNQTQVFGKSSLCS